jgi:hypothetical protein
MHRQNDHGTLGKQDSLIAVKALTVKEVDSKFLDTSVATTVWLHKPQGNPKSLLFSSPFCAISGCIFREKAFERQFPALWS